MAPNQRRNPRRYHTEDAVADAVLDESENYTTEIDRLKMENKPLDQFEPFKQGLAEVREKLRKKANRQVCGTFKLFNVKNEYGFTSRNHTCKDIFAHRTAITRNKPKKIRRLL